jgi:hypothetical protein
MSLSSSTTSTRMEPSLTAPRVCVCAVSAAGCEPASPRSATAGSCVSALLSGFAVASWTSTRAGFDAGERGRGRLRGDRRRNRDGTRDGRNRCSNSCWGSAPTRHRSAALQQPRQSLDQLLIIALSFVANGFHAGQHLPGGIHQLQQRSSNVRAQPEFAVAQLAEQIFSHVRHGLELGKAEKSAGALDGVNGAEDARQRVAVSRIFLQMDQLAIQQIEILAAFDQKLANDVVAHAKSNSPDEKPWT